MDKLYPHNVGIFHQKSPSDCHEKTIRLLYYRASQLFFEINTTDKCEFGNFIFTDNILFYKYWAIEIIDTPKHFHPTIIDLSI